MSAQLREHMLLCMGNPLLDITAHADEKFLEKYDLQANNAILADPKHEHLNEDLIKNYKVDFTAGGASLNTARIAQIILKTLNVTVYMGCIGKDKYGEILSEKAKSDGVDVRFQYSDEKPTGTGTVIITNDGKYRSIVADLSASQMFTIDHIKKPEHQEIINSVEYFYITGFFLIVSPDSVTSIAEHASQRNKLFAMNLSATYICEAFQETLTPLLPYCDILFANEMEAVAFSKQYKLDTEDIAEIAQKIANLPKHNNSRKRLVVITQGEDPVIVAQESGVKQFDVKKLSPERVIDTNGAGDAFVGGFLSQLIQQKSYDVCVKYGIWAASEVIQQSGCVLKTTEYSEW